MSYSARGRARRKSKYSRSFKSRSGRKFRPGYDRTGGYNKFVNRPAAIAQELKFLDSSHDDNPIPSAGQVIGSVNLIAQGVTQSTRVGRKCTIKAINWHWCVGLPARTDVATPPTVNDTVRVMMILDKQCNGAAATVTDVLFTADWQSFNNLSNSNRFRVLYDKTVDLNYTDMIHDEAANTFSNHRVNHTKSFYKKCNIPIEFSATSGALTTVRSNNIFVMVISSSGIATIDSVVRIRFTDS